jgi:opacity protein-like surface antigen
MRKQRMSLMVGALAVVLAAALQAADVTGKWVAQVPGRDGQTRETTFTFKAEGETLTGSVTGRQGDVPITDGKISGDDLSFTVVMNFQGNEVKMLYKGKVAGQEIKFTRQREGGDQTQEFVAKRATS